MPVHHLQTNFSAGVISKRLKNRVDLTRYDNAVDEISNFLPLPHGGLVRRPGTHFTAEVKNSAQAVRLFPFEYSTTQAYMCEFGHNYIRFYTLNGRLESGGSPVEVVTPYTEAQLPLLRFAQESDIMYIVHSSHEIHKLTRTSATAFTLTKLDPFDFVGGPFLDDNAVSTKTLNPSGTTGNITIAASGHTPFTSDHVNSLWKIGGTVSDIQGYVKVTGFTNSSTVSATVIETLSTSSATDEWAEGAWSDERGYPSDVTFFEQRLVFAGSTFKPQTIWMSKTGSYENHTPGANAADAVVFTVASNQVNVIRWLSAQSNLLIGTAGGEFRATGGTESSITPTSLIIVPESRYGSAAIRPIQVANVTLYIQRAKKKLRQLSFDAAVDSYVSSNITLLAEHITEDSKFDSLAYQQEDDSVIWVTLVDGSLVSCTWLRDQEVIAWANHTIGGVFGSATVTVTDYANIAVGTTLTITKSDGSTVTFTSEAISGSAPSSSLGFRPNQDNDTTADNIYTAVNAHVDFTVANPAANVVTINETLRLGATPLTITSSDTTRLATANEAPAFVESIATLPDETGPTGDQLWLVVKRTINGSTKRYVEYLDPTVHTDSTLTGTHGTPATSFSGLTHLEGQTVGIVGDEAVYDRKSVASAAVALSTGENAITNSEIGLPYESKVVTLEPEVSTSRGTSLGRKKRWARVQVRVVDTPSLKINGSQTPSRSAAMVMGSAPTIPAEQDIRVTNLGYDDKGKITIEQTQPVKTTIPGVFGLVSVEDD